MTTEELQRPVQLLKDISQKLLQGQVPTTPKRLEELYAHLSGSLDDVFAYCEEQLKAAQELTATTNQPELSHEFSELRHRVQVALQGARESFFSAKSFPELQSRAAHIELCQAQMEGALLGLDELMLRIDLPPAPFLPKPEVPEALEELGQCLASIQRHLNEGDREQLEAALAHVEQARELIRKALCEPSD